MTPQEFDAYDAEIDLITDIRVLEELLGRLYKTKGVGNNWASYQLLVDKAQCKHGRLFYRRSLFGETTND